MTQAAVWPLLLYTIFLKKILIIYTPEILENEDVSIKCFEHGPIKKDNDKQTLNRN